VTQSDAPDAPPAVGDAVDRRLSATPIALVGMAGLFPQAHDVRDYWQNVVDATDCTSEVPADRWKVEDYWDPDPAAADKTYSRRGGFLPEVDFDPLEFGLPPNQLEVTSTLQTLSLGVARDVLCDAGAPGSSWYDPSRTGVVLGVTGPVPLMHPLAARLSTPVLEEVVRSCGLTDDDARTISAKYVKAFAPWVENSFPGLLANVVAGRVANRLGLGGMNSTVDAACAASLSATRVAIAELVDRRADMMITGGCDTENSIFIYLCFSKVGALSHHDRIRPFDTSADGTLLGEGIGMLALKRLADAERDGDRVYAVIRGLGSSSDGRATSIYAPRAEGQRLALDRAYADADCSPASVELFEAHATGTLVGDRTELTALGGLLREHSDEDRFAAIGSVKSQIGHTKGAAGTASMMKLALGLYHKTLPPTIGVEEPNEALAAADAPLYVNTRTRPWILDPQRPRRRAAASAMGFGGTNFHVVLEEATGDRATVRNLHRTARAHVWHAETVAELRTLVAAGEAAQDGPIPDGHVRLGFAAVDTDDEAELRALALSALDAEADAPWSHPRGVWFRPRALDDLRVGAVFAGQGSQYLEMGLEAALNNPAVAGAFDEANASFADAARRLGTVVFPPPVFDAETRHRQEAALRRTEYAQPAIGALAVGQFRFLRDRGLECSAMLGHSFGELTALWAAGSLSDADFFRLARARGAAMAPAEGDTSDPGAMAAVSADRERVITLLAELGVDDAVVCNHNAPDQVVVGGGTDQVAAVVAACGERGIGAKNVPVAAAFHTRHVAHAVDRFRPVVDAVEIGEPRVPVIADAAGASYGADVAANRDVLAGQLLEPVEFVAGLTELAERGCTVIVEFGPKQVLTQLVRRTLGDAVIAVPTDAGPIGDGDLALKQAAVQLAVLGAPLTGIGRDDAPDREPAAPRGMTVGLTAAEYVPEERAEAYRAALADTRPLQALSAAPSAAPAAHTATVQEPTATRPGMTAAGTEGPTPEGPTPEGTAPGSALATRSSAGTLATPSHAEPVAPAAASGDDDVLARHTALHGRYLDGQLDIAARLVDVWEQRGDDPCAAAVAQAIAAQSVAISETHTRANDVLASLAGLAGTPRPATPQTNRHYPVDAPSVAIAPSPPEAPNQPAPVPSWREPAEGPSIPDVRTNGHHEAAAVAPPVASQEPEAFDADALRHVLVEVVADKTGYPAGMVDPGMDLEADLGVDSIKRVQVLGAVQERYPRLPAVGPESLAELRTLDQIVAHLAASAPAGPVTTSSAPAVPESATEAFDADALRRVLVEVVADKTGYPAAMVDPGMDLEADLGVDSIKRVQILGAVQERYPQLPAVGPESLAELRTLDQIVAHLAASAPAPAASVTSAPAPAELGGFDAEALRRVPQLPAVGPESLAELRTLDQIVGHLAAEPATPREAGSTAPATSDPAPADDDPEPARYAIDLVPLPARDDLDAPYAPDPLAVIVDRGGPEPDALATTLGVTGWRVRRVTLPDTAGEDLAGSEMPGLAEHLAPAFAGDDRVDACLVVLRDEEDLGSSLVQLADAVLVAGHAQEALARTARGGTRAAFVTVTRCDGGLGLRGRLVAGDAVLAGVGGLVKTMAREAPGVFSRAIDVAPVLDAGAAAVLVVGELADAALDTPEVGIDADGERWTTAVGETARPAPGGEPTVGTDDVVVVTGGARGVTALCVRALAERTRAEFVLLGRTELTDEPAWATEVTDADLQSATIAALSADCARPSPRDVARTRDDLLAQREVRATLEAVRTVGSQVRYVAVDVTDPAAVRTALSDESTRATVLVHGAGALADSLLPVKTATEVHRVLAAKLAGLANVLAAVPDAPLREVVLFGSVAGVFGNPGQADYALANEALARWAASLRSARPDRRIRTLAWGAWDGGMVDADLRELFLARGVALLDPADGTRLFVDSFADDTDGWFLVGERAPLAGATADPVGELTVRRDLGRLRDEPVLTAHRVGDDVVLPAAVAVGWMVHTAERTHPGAHATAVRDLAVQRGLVFGDGSAELALTLTPSADGVTTAVRGDGPATRYAAALELTDDTSDRPARTVRTDWPRDRVGQGPEDGVDLYRRGVQFHGPALQGMRRVLDAEDDRIVVECRIDPGDLARGGYRGRHHDPVLADVVLQVPPVLGARVLGSACLPLGIGRMELLAPLPADGPFVVIADHARPGPMSLRCDVTVCAVDGRVLQRWTDVDVVTTPDLDAKFARAVEGWSGSAAITSGAQR